ncbi:MAG: hypothetical protein U1E05_06375 [Patescibacteria group bacterium]|nr:hypothetical protein [Patescibacteria group bacterium]
MTHAVRVLLVIIVALALGASGGCGGGVNYPKAQVTSPLNRPGTCVVCKTKIESVADANLVVIDGVQYTLCGDACLPKLHASLEWDRGR